MLSFTCEGRHADRNPPGTDWWVARLRDSSQFGVIGRKVPSRLMLQYTLSSDPEDYKGRCKIQRWAGPWSGGVRLRAN